jgi:hypothetical protein
MVDIERNNRDRKLHSLHSRQLIVDDDSHAATIPKTGHFINGRLFRELASRIL